MADPFQPKFVDLVRNYSTTAGTADFKLGSVVNGYTGFIAACAVGDQFYYSAIGVDRPTEREVGRGTLLANGFIKREPIGGVKTVFSTGTKSIALIAAAEWFSETHALLGSVGTVGQSLMSSATPEDARAALQLSGGFNVKWFGAKGDSNATASTGTDDTAAIQAALNYINSIGGGTLYFPEGYYKVTSYVTLCANLRIVGASWTTTGIVTTMAGGGGANLAENTRNGSAFYSNWPSNSSTRANIVVEHIACIATNAANAGAAFYDNCGTFITLGHCWFKGFKYGAIFDQTELADILDCIIEPRNGSGACVWLVNAADLKAGNFGGFTNRISVQRCQINAGNTVYGILDDGGNTHAFVDNNYNGCLKHIRAAGVQGLKISGGEFESATSECIQFEYRTLLTNSGTGGCGAVWLGGGAEIIPTTGQACVNAVSLGSITIDGVLFGNTTSAKFVGAVNTGQIWATGITNAGGGNTFDGRATKHFEVGYIASGGVAALRTNLPFEWAGTTVFNSAGVLQAAGHPALTGDVISSAGSLTTTIAANAVTYAKMQQVTGLSVVGNSGNANANAAAITGTDGQVLRVSGTVLGFGAIATAGFSDAAVTYAKIQNVAASRLLGNPTGVAGAPSEISVAGGLSFSGTTLTAAGALTPTSVAASGAVTSSGGGVGYATGAGGTVTQLTSKTTAVTLNKLCGQIIMASGSLAAAAIASFTLNNSQIAVDDRLSVWVKSGNATAGSYRVWVEGNASGARTIVVENRSAGALNEALVLGFELTKAVTA